MTLALRLTFTRYETNLALFTLFNWDYGFREGPVWDFAFAQDANNTEVDYGQVLHGRAHPHPHPHAHPHPHPHPNPNPNPDP